MKKYTYLLMVVFSLTLISNKCTLHTKAMKEYTAKKQTVSSDYNSKNQKYINSFTIEEDEDNFISRISDIEINDEKLTIIDEVSGKINIYNYNDGKYIKSITPGQYIIDSVAKSKFKSNNATQGIKYIQKEDYEKKGIDADYIRSFLRTYFLKIKYNRDEYKVLGLSYIPGEVEGSSKHYTDNRTFIGTFDKDFNLKNCYPLEVLKQSYAVPFFINTLNSGNLIVSSSNFAFRDKKFGFDSMVTMSIYDYDGKFISNIGYMPEIYYKNNLAYQEKWIPIVTTIENKPYIIYPREMKVYSENNKVNFELYNLPYSNDSGMTYIELFYRAKSIKGENADPKELGKLVPLEVVYSFNRNNHLGVIYLVFDDNTDMGFYYILQVYTTNGKLISQANIYDDPNNQIHNFKYDSQNDILCIIKKNEEGWTLEKYKL